WANGGPHTLGVVLPPGPPQICVPLQPPHDWTVRTCAQLSRAVNPPHAALACMQSAASGSGTQVTVTDAVPRTAPLAAVTANGPPGWLPAVNRPLALMLPPPDTDQATGADAATRPNWSCTLAANW